MPNFNTVTLMGHLTRDPELRNTQGGTTICAFTLAVSNKFKAKNGEMKEDVLFIDCTSFGKQGEVVSKYAQKGSPLFVQGRLKLDQWEAKDGTKRSKIGVIVEKFEFLSKSGEQGGSKSSQSSKAPADLSDAEIPF